MGADEVGTLKGPTEHRVILGGSLGSQGPHGEHGGLQSTRAAKFIGCPRANCVAGHKRYFLRRTTPSAVRQRNANLGSDL